MGDKAQGYDRDGLRSVAHLGGKGGMAKFVKSKGQYNPDLSPRAQRLIRAVGAKTAYIEPGRPGRTDIAKASTGECEMNCSTANILLRKPNISK